MTDKFLIVDGNLLTWVEGHDIMSDGAVYIEDGLIKEIGSTRELQEKYPSAEKISANGQLVMPGNICAHTHFYGAFARGMAIPGPAPKDFPDILEKLWWPLDQALSKEDVRYSALVCLVDAIKHGTTTLIDHHASPNALSGSLDVIASEVERSGLRAVLCYEVTDRYGKESAQASIDENVRFIKSMSGNSRLAGTFGLHASLTLDDDTLSKCAGYAEELDTGLHIHVAEHESDEYDSLHKYGKRTIDRLHSAGILGEKSIVAHAVHVDGKEMEILRDTQTWVTHQPRSNMNNAVGASDIDGMLRMGIKVCLGNDGFSNNMWADWKTAYLFHKVWHRDPRRADGMNIVQMGIHNNTALAEVFFPDSRPGKLIEGTTADIIFVDYHPTTPLTNGNLPWHIIFGFESSMVTTTIASGKILMRNRELLTLDEKAITARSRELAPKTWERYYQFVAKIR